MKNQKIYALSKKEQQKTAEKNPKNSNFVKNRDCECPAPRIRIAYPKEAVLKGYILGCLRRVSY